MLYHHSTIATPSGPCIQIFVSCASKMTPNIDCVSLSTYQFVDGMKLKCKVVPKRLMSSLQNKLVNTLSRSETITLGVPYSL